MYKRQVVEEAARMEASGLNILKLNIGNPAPFGFNAPEEVILDMRQSLWECQGYSDSKGLFSARKAIMQYCHCLLYTSWDFSEKPGQSRKRSLRSRQKRHPKRGSADARGLSEGLFFRCYLVRK